MKSMAQVGLRILGGVAIVVLAFFGTLFLLNYLDDGGKRDRWQERLVNGQPVVVHLICETQTVLDCFDTYTITYHGSGASRCEHVLKNGEGQDLTGWCNGHPEEHSFSIRGALFDYNRSGEVLREGKVVGHLSEQ
jgi:hypothetical protein